MSKVAQEVLAEFGATVKRARTSRGWYLDGLAKEMKGGSKSFLSDIENGKRNIGPVTVGKLVIALGLDPAWNDRFLDEDGSVAGPTEDDQRSDSLLDHAANEGIDAPLKDAGITEVTIIDLAQRIAAETDDLGQAWSELQNAMDMAVRVQTEGAAPSNHAGFVDEVLKRVAALSRDGQYSDALAEIEEALKEAESQTSRLLTSGVEVALLDRDTQRAANLLIRQAELEAGGQASIEDLRQLFVARYELGRDKGLNLQLRLAIDLAKTLLSRAVSADDKGLLGNDLGVALQTLGERESGTKRLEEAVTAYRNALVEWTRDRVPLQWAGMQMNLGNVLKTLGERESGTQRLVEAVTAYRAALEEWTRDRAPFDWAGAQMNLGAALQILGARESGTERLEEAIDALRAALEAEAWTRDKVPLQWAGTQMNLGNALTTFGKRESGTDRLEEADTAYHAALEERTRDRVPFDWAMTLHCLADLELAFFDKSGDAKHLVSAEEHAFAARDGYVQVEASHYIDWIEKVFAGIERRHDALE